MIEDRFLEDDPVPLFLADPLDETEQSGVRKVLSSDFFRKAVLGFAATSTAFAVAWVVYAIMFASVTASEVSRPAPRISAGQSASPLQSSNSAQALPAPPATPSGDLLAAFKTAVDNKAEVDQPAGETAFNQFKAWAVEEDVQAAPARQSEPPQIARAEAVDAARTEIVPLPKRRPTHFEHAARAHEGQAHDAPPQNAPSLLRQLGWRN